MTACVPIRDMKNTSSFNELVQKEGDVTVTKNGYDELHCLSVKEYNLLKEEVAKSKLLSRVLLAEEEIAADKFESFEGFSSKIRREYGL